MGRGGCRSYTTLQRRFAFRLKDGRTRQHAVLEGVLDRVDRVLVPQLLVLQLHLYVPCDVCDV